VSIVGCASRRMSSAEALAQLHGAAAYSTAEELLAGAAPNLVVVTTHESARLEPLELALAAGAHLFVEKPLYARVDQDRITVDDYHATREVVKLWDPARSSFGVNFNYRTMPHMMRMMADVADGSLGEILLVNGYSHLACWSHMIDLIQWWLGRIETVSARVSGLGDRLDRVCTLTLPGGVIGTLTGSAGVFERANLLRIEVRGSRARAVVEGVNGSYRRLHESPDARIDAWPSADVSGEYYGASFRGSIDGYCAALRAGVPSPVSAEDGLAELAVEAAVARSAATGEPVRVDSL
jgi:predicted dehydrogenase